MDGTYSYKSASFLSLVSIKEYKTLLHDSFVYQFSDCGLLYEFACVYYPNADGFCLLVPLILYVAQSGINIILCE